MKPRGILIAGNWKMNHGIQETKAFFTKLSSQKVESMKFGKGLQSVIFPSFLSLATARKFSDALPFPLEIGAQNAHWEEKGAFTGEVSGSSLREMGIHCVLIGHSERRHLFGETDEIIRKRTEGLLGQGLRVVLCIGETQMERQAGRTEDVLIRQLSSAIAQCPSDRLILAYEPVWAIGTGLTATTDQIDEAHKIIRSWLKEHHGKEAGTGIQILYGGSVTAENLRSILGCPNVDGALVGGASLKAEVYFELLRIGSQSS